MKTKNLYKATITDINKNKKSFDIKFLADSFESAFEKAKTLGSRVAAHHDALCNYECKVISVESVNILEKDIIEHDKRERHNI